MLSEFHEQTEQAKFVKAREITPIAFEVYVNSGKAAMAALYLMTG